MLYRVESSSAAHGELHNRFKSLEAELRLVSGRHADVAAAGAEAETRARSAAGRLQLTEDELTAVKIALQVGMPMQLHYSKRK